MRSTIFNEITGSLLITKRSATIRNVLNIRRPPETKKSLWIDHYLGLGDQVNMRPFVIEATKRYERVYLTTPFPELYYKKPDNLYFTKPTTHLRLQNKNIQKQPKDIWSAPIGNVKKIRPSYGKGLNILDELCKAILFEEGTKLDYELPVNPEWVKKAEKILENVSTKKKICVVKYPALREEWRVETRLPKTEYIQLLIDKYKDEYFFISVADIEEGVDEHCGELKGINLQLDTADIWATIGLVHLSDMVIAYPSFFLPLCIALKKRAFFLFGGYHAPENYLNWRMDLERFGHVAPQPFCSCLKYRHDCNKDIDEDRIIEEFEKLRSKKDDLLLVRLGGKRRDFYTQIAQNKYIKQKHNVSIVDVGGNSEEYSKNRGLFRNLFVWGEKNNCLLIRFLKFHYNKIVVIAQKLHPTSTFLEKVCQENSIKYVWTEAFFDNKLIFDKTGLQYCPDNEIVRYVKKIKMRGKINLPKSTRTPQTDVIGKKELFLKYGLSPEKKYIVMFGQTIFDMSLKHSLIPGVDNFQKYAGLIINNNPDVTFLYKNHPHYKGVFARRKRADVGFMNDYPNVIEVDENIQTLFNAFSYFTAFSSTTIFEGLIRNKKFATMGYHFCNNDKLVYQMKDTSATLNLYEKLKKFKISQQIKKRYLYFICNYYAISLGSKQLLDKLKLTPEEYYARRY